MPKGMLSGTLNLQIAVFFTCKSFLPLLQCKINKNFVFSLVKLIINFLSAASMLLSIPSVGPSPNTKKLFLRLAMKIYEQLSSSKITGFIKNSLSKLLEPAP